MAVDALTLLLQSGGDREAAVRRALVKPGPWLERLMNLPRNKRAARSLLRFAAALVAAAAPDDARKCAAVAIEIASSADDAAVKRQALGVFVRAVVSAFEMHLVPRGGSR